MDPSAETRIRELLEPGERLLWSGKPKRSMLHGDSQLGGWIVGAWGISAALFGVIVTRLKDDAPERQITDIAERILTAYLAVGLFTVFIATAVRTLFRWFQDPPAAVVYGLTDRSAIVLGELGKKMRLVDLDTLDSVRTEVREWGTGTIFCQSRALSWWHRSSDGNSVEGPLFSNLERPQFVHAKLMRALGKPVADERFRLEHHWERRLRTLLDPGEELHWLGQPQRPKSIDRPSLAPSLLALPFFILPAYLVREAVASRDPRRESIGAVSDLQLKAIIAVATMAIMFGLYLLVLRFFVDAWRRKRTSFALTGRRAIVRERGLVRSVPIDMVSSVSISDESEERGMIHCRSEAMERRMLGMTRWTITRPHDGPLFVDIASPQAVHTLLTGLIAGTIDSAGRPSNVIANEGDIIARSAD
jgi:hypothetical protein